MKSIYLQGLCALFAAVLWQDSASLSAGDAPPEKPDLEGQLAPWSETHGGHWRVEADDFDGYAELIHGGAAPSPRIPVDDAGWIELARDWLEDTRELHGVAAETLVGQRVTFLPLGQIGSSDKWTVRFEQRIDDLPVVDGTVNVLFDVDGRLLSIQALATPELEEMNTVPFLTEGHAKTLAAERYRDNTGFIDGRIGTPELVLLPVLERKVYRPKLAWQVDVLSPEDGSAPAAWRFWLEDATGELLQEHNRIHHLYDVYGTVRSNATPGTAPDYASNPETQQTLQHLRVTSSAGTTYTDANGNFNYPGVNSATNVTVEYYGTYNDVQHVPGSEYSLTVSAQPNQQNDILMNPSSQALVTAQANAYKQLTGCRDWITSIVPTDTTADFRAISNCNISSTCNAYYNGVSVNFYQAGGGCVNTAYSTVVVHEYGHWLNDLYGSGNGSDGFGEGNADVFAMYMYDDPIVGLDFCGSGCNVRTGTNTRPYCGDGNGGCYGQVHTDGEVWMGAAWKIRTRLKNTLGSSAGVLAADTLFVSWMNAYDQTTIDSIMEIQWLTLDDDDGNIDNGTPNYTDIDQGFRDQQFPGYDLPGVSISNVTDLPDTTNEVGPYLVDATIVAQVSPPITTADLYYRVNGGAWTAVAMTPGAGDVYTGSIPGQSSPANVNYYVYAEDNGSASRSFPPDAPTSYLDFNVGEYEVLFFDDFETSGDNGWTHASFGDTSNNHDDWQHGSPGGKAGDPSSAFSGSEIWGTDLGVGSWNGEYQDQVHNYLRSPVIDCSSAYGTRLRFQRWLRIEKGTWDQARIKVNGTLVWENPAGTDMVESAWSFQDIDISTAADGESSVQIEFSLESDTSVTFGGWNIDDVAVLYLADSGITDCNDNGIDDAIDISSGTSLDCNSNGIPDECELMGNDCNANGIPDDCDVAGADCNSNGIPDDCDTDCNANGTPDDCETFTDCNSNSIPDE